MTTALDGTNISPDKWKYKGIDRDSNVNKLLTNITTALSYHRVRGLYFLAVVFLHTNRLLCSLMEFIGLYVNKAITWITGLNWVIGWASM